MPAKERQWWHRLLRSPFKHCFLLKPEGPNHWTLFEPWWSRVLMGGINNHDAHLFLEWGREGVIVQVEEHVPGKSSQLRGWISCAALIAHVLGRSYCVYTPEQLLKRLLRERETRLW